MSHEALLGIIAGATVVMAVVQVGVIVAAAILARRIGRLAETVERDLKPLFGHLDSIGRDASKATSLAVAQVERVDRLFTDVTAKVEETLNVVQASIAGPAREGRALMIAVRAALGAIRDMRENSRRRSRAEDEDALFI